MKKDKVIKNVLIVLAIILISIISFIGIYVKDKNTMKNLMKDFSLGMDLKGYRKVTLKLDDSTNTVYYDENGKTVENVKEENSNNYKKEEVKVNQENLCNEEYYNYSANILKNRMKKLGIDEYEVRVNDSTGEIKFNLSEGKNTDDIVSILSQVGKFEICDADTGELLLDNDNIKSANSGYYNQENGYIAYFQIKFDKDGIEKFKDITKTYVESKETDENGEEVDKSKKVKITLDGTEMGSLSFDSEVTDGVLVLSIGQATKDTKTFKGYVKQASTLSVLLNSGVMPLTYNMDKNQYISSSITSNEIMIAKIVFIICIAGISTYIIMEYKEKGILNAVLSIGFIAVYLLIIRYTNVTITIEGVAGIILTVILNYILQFVLLNNNEINMKSIVLQDWKVIIPIIILTIVFTMSNWLPVYSFGMTTFWGIITLLIYNCVIQNAKYED